jgi:hypothetical protein
MPKFRVEIPVTVFCTYEVEAKDENAALDVPVTLSSLFYDDATGGISLARHKGARRINGIADDNAEWDRAEVFPADEDDDS